MSKNEARVWHDRYGKLHVHADTIKEAKAEIRRHKNLIDEELKDMRFFDGSVEVAEK